ncbi:formimidoylglutamase [uncultured Croceitalea sp.]|uniref:formimidoylglutamase n=1 Tax=uncultured Croceitalea sp. TaxID=1798908 RepID=UPI003305CC97
MQNYHPPLKASWSGRNSTAQLYLHEKVTPTALSKLTSTKNTLALLGYACDEGVRLNKGRVGAKEGPMAIRKALAKMPNHLKDTTSLIDVGDIVYAKSDLDAVQKELALTVTELLQKNTLPVLLGGGHDIAYGHYNGIKSYLIAKNKRPSIGIINFDAHFDLRSDETGPNSGTPFFQIANENEPFHYLCLGIRKDANDKALFQTAMEFDVTYVDRGTFRIQFAKEINTWIRAFMEKVEHIYVTIDLDGFSSAYAPGVSAASPMGFSPDIVLESLETIIASGKLISMDIAEMNPKFDIDDQTAKLAASLIHKVIHAEFF